jgi:hypothetical protein
MDEAFIQHFGETPDEFLKDLVVRVGDDMIIEPNHVATMKLIHSVVPKSETSEERQSAMVRLFALALAGHLKILRDPRLTRYVLRYLLTRPHVRNANHDAVDEVASRQPPPPSAGRYANSSAEGGRCREG